jgi:hypothetical protein
VAWALFQMPEKIAFKATLPYNAGGRQLNLERPQRRIKKLSIF